MTDFVLEVFVSQVEDHCLLAHHLFAHQASLHCHWLAPSPIGAATPAQGSPIYAAGGGHAEEALATALEAHHLVVELEDHLVGDAVVER